MRTLLIALSALLILSVAMFFAPQLLEATNSSCGAVERLALRQVASSSKDRGEERAGIRWAFVLMNFSDGAIVATALQQEYPGWPTAVSCAMTYYAGLTGFRWREGSGSPDRAGSPNPVPTHSAATERFSPPAISTDPALTQGSGSPDRADSPNPVPPHSAATERFSPGDIRELLQSKQPAQSAGSTGREVNRTASRGTSTGTAQRLNPSQRDALIGLLQEQLHRCWVVPVALQSVPKPPVPSVRIQLNQDGSLAAEPAVLNRSPEPLFGVAADSATRAARRCAPLRIPAHFAPYYQDWKEVVVSFNLRDMR